MSNKVAVLTVAFNEPTLIGPCVRQFKGVIPLYHMVLVSENPWRGGIQSDFGLTGVKANDNGADNVIQGYWSGQAEQFNFGLEILEDMGFEWAIICDADEFYTYHDIGKLLKDINFCDREDMQAIVAPRMDVYWKFPFFKIIPAQHDSPIIAIRTEERFLDKRHSEVTRRYSAHGTLHHFSYVRSDSEMKKKINTFEHSHEFDTEKWYRNKWQNWNINSEDLHPVVPEQFKKAVFDPAPEEIINNYYG